MANDLHAALHLAPRHAKSLTDSPSPVSDESFHGRDDHTSANQGTSLHGFDDVLAFSQGTHASSFDTSALDQDDGLGDFDGFENPLNASEDSSSGPKRRSRRAPNTAERRATHNAVERARRETLNGRFMDLAAALPSMSHVKRPSKSMIVNRSLDFVDASLQREASLMEENNSLRKQVNQLRTQLGLPPIDETPSTSTLAAGACDAARKVKKQRTMSGSSAGVHDAALAAVAARRSSMSSEQNNNNNNNNSSSFNQSLSGIGESPSVKTSSVGTPNDDLPGNSPRVALASTPATGPASQSLDTSAASPQPDLSKLAGPNLNGGDLWGMRAQLQAAAQAAMANANAFNQQQHQQQSQHQKAASTPSVPSFDFFTQQQQPQQNGSAPGPHMDIGSYLMALHLQQQQHQQQQQQMHHTTPSPFGMIGGLGFGASAPPMSSAGHLASFASQAPALSPMGGPAAEGRASPWF